MRFRLTQFAKHPWANRWLAHIPKGNLGGQEAIGADGHLLRQPRDHICVSRLGVVGIGFPMRMSKWQAWSSFLPPRNRHFPDPIWWPRFYKSLEKAPYLPAFLVDPQGETAIGKAMPTTLPSYLPLIEMGFNEKAGQSILRPLNHLWKPMKRVNETMKKCRRSSSCVQASNVRVILTWPSYEHTSWNATSTGF